MKKSIIAILALASLLLAGCCQDRTPRAKHVIFIGFDGMSAIGLQRAETPNFNYLIENGAVSIDTRCGRETSSSQNWMAMVSGAPFEMSGITSNAWNLDNYTIDPAVSNRLGIFPTVFDDIRAQKPEARMECYIEWGGESRMYDMDVFDKTLYTHGDEKYSGEEVMEAAFSSYLENEPDFLFLSVDVTDHAGHAYGHESQGYFDCIHRMDELTGAFVKELEARGMFKDAVLIITADHGGINFSHGGDSMSELQIPVIMYGKGVTKGKVMEHANMIYDNAATIAGLLGVKLPDECRGKFMMQAFEPKTDVCYVPTPLVHPFKGVVPAGETVSISADYEGTEIYYTLDGSTPTIESTKYEGPFELPGSCTVQAIGYRNGCYSGVASNFLYASVPEGEAAVQYKLYRGWKSQELPDFTKFGRADAAGYTSAFTLDSLPIDSSEDHFAVIFSSNLKLAKGGKYKFALSSDDGSRLIIDNETIIDNNGSHSLTTAYGTAELEAGSHIVKVEYFEDTSGQSLELTYALEGSPLRPIFSSELER